MFSLSKRELGHTTLTGLVSYLIAVLAIAPSECRVNAHGRTNSEEQHFMKPLAIKLVLLLSCFSAHAAFAHQGEIASATDAAGKANFPSSQRIQHLHVLRDKLGKSIDAWAAKQILGAYVDEEKNIVVVTYGRLGSVASVEAWLDRKGIGRDDISIQRYASQVNKWIDPPPPPSYPFIGPY